MLGCSRRNSIGRDGTHGRYTRARLGGCCGGSFRVICCRHQVPPSRPTQVRRRRQPDARRKNILSFGDDDVSAVAWAVERADGGRGFAFTGGHSHKNWANENVRRLALNAILWTAKADVPKGGVQ